MPFETLDHFTPEALQNNGLCLVYGAVEKTRKTFEKPCFARVPRSNVVGLQVVGFNRLAASGPTLAAAFPHISGAVDSAMFTGE